MAFTATDLDNIDAALIVAAVEGFASVQIGGQSVTNKSLDELLRVRAMVAGQIAAANTEGRGGIRTRVMIPPGCG